MELKLFEKYDYNGLTVKLIGYTNIFNEFTSPSAWYTSSDGLVNMINKNLFVDNAILLNREQGDKLYNIIDAAKLLGIASTTIYKWNKKNRIKFIQVGYFQRVTETEIKRVSEIERSRDK